MNTSINYNAVISICDEITRIVNELNNQFNRIQDITKNGNNIWNGTAAKKYYEEIQRKYSIYLDSVPMITEYLKEVKELIERNKITDSTIKEEEFTKINLVMPSITGTVFSSNIPTLKNNVITANDNVQSTTSATDATSMNQKTIDDIKTNNNVNSNLYKGNEDFSFSEPKNMQNNSTSSNTTQNIGSGVGAVSLEDLVKSLNNK